VAAHMLLLWSIYLFLTKALAWRAYAKCTLLITKPQCKMHSFMPSLSLSCLTQIERLHPLFPQDHLQDADFYLLYPYLVWHTLKSVHSFSPRTWWCKMLVYGHNEQIPTSSPPSRNTKVEEDTMSSSCQKHSSSTIHI